MSDNPMTADQWVEVAGILGMYTPGPHEKPSPWDHLNIGGKLARALSECRAQLREAEDALKLVLRLSANVMLHPRTYPDGSGDWVCSVYPHGDDRTYIGLTKLDALRAALADAAPPQEEVTNDGV